ncbi:MAG: preprotein translocase subunit SecG [Candidatus Dojkabacteria bacterium]
MEILFWIQAVLGVAIVVAILLQRGTSGLGTVFGGGVSDSFRTKRGFEAFVYNLTIFLVVMFVANALAIAITGAN